MKSYLIYNKDGIILRRVICPDNMCEIQLKEGEFIIEGNADDRSQKVIDGKVVDKTAEEIQTLNYA